MDIINIVILSDNNYAMPTCVLLTSLEVNRDRNVCYNIYVISCGINTVNEQKLLSLRQNNFNVSIINADTKKYAEFERENFHVSTVDLLKFDLANIFQDLDKILYLDCDMIVQKDLSELFDTSIEGKYAAVVKDMNPMMLHKPSILEKLNINHHFYFNAGMMLLNLKKIREDALYEKFIDYKKNGINYFMSQDTMNVVFQEQVVYISLYFNLLTTLFDRFDLQKVSLFYDLALLKNKNDYFKNAVIVHLAGRNKPWQFKIRYFTKLFKSYYLQSPYKNEELTLKARMPFVKYFRKVVKAFKNEGIGQVIRKVKNHRPRERHAEISK